MDTALTTLELDFLREIHTPSERRKLLRRLSAAGLLDDFLQIEKGGNPAISPIK